MCYGTYDPNPNPRICITKARRTSSYHVIVVLVFPQIIMLVELRLHRKALVPVSLNEIKEFSSLLDVSFCHVIRLANSLANGLKLKKGFMSLSLDGSYMFLLFVGYNALIPLPVVVRLCNGFPLFLIICYFHQLKKLYCKVDCPFIVIFLTTD